MRNLQPQNYLIAIDAVVNGEGVSINCGKAIDLPVRIVVVASINMAVNVIALLMHSPIPPNGSCQTNKFIQGKVYLAKEIVQDGIYCGNVGAYMRSDPR